MLAMKHKSYLQLNKFSFKSQYQYYQTKKKRITFKNNQERRYNNQIQIQNYFINNVRQTISFLMPGDQVNLIHNFQIQKETTYFWKNLGIITISIIRLLYD
ncbi:unnamed protein product [Paramecium sonneborni]|uniref:Uncharacterized protein n=1 Tax=Paramecium sonneborni TaxID=65129 RepID=A0A8S1PDM3_9CILI|nr:unnamed protein product [Paramecium sonneborni]